MCSRILLQTPRHVTGAGGCNLPLSHMSAPVTLLLANGVNVDAPTVAVHHTRQTALGSRTHHLHRPASFVCANVWTAFLRRSWRSRRKRRNSKHLGESDRRIALEERYCDGSSHLQVLRRFFARPGLSFSRYPPLPQIGMRNMYARLCAQKERGLLWLISSLACFSLIDTPTIQPSFR